MQSENYGYHKTPRRGEVFEYVEKAKPGMAHEADEDQLSQPSTMQSLGNVDSTPEKTPTSEGWSNIKGDIKQKAGELKGKFVEKFGHEIQPEKDLDSDVKENIKEINEEIRHQPHGEEEVVEGQGQAKFKKDFSSENRQSTGQSGSESQDLKDISREILDKALNKIDDMRSKASQQGEQLKQGASEASSKISETVEQKSEFSSHTKVEVEKGSEPLTKDNKEEILELAQQLTDKIQELKTAGQLSSTQQSSQFSEQQKQTQNSSEESHEHHHLSAESRSFKPTQESHELVEKVKEGLEEHVPLTEVVEEFDHEKHPQSQERGQPTLDKLQQNISNKLSGKVEEVKSKLNAPRQEESGFSQERRSEEQERPRENLQSQQQSGSEERGQPAFDKLQQGAENLSNKLSGKVEEVKNKFNAPEQERESEERGQSSQSQQPKRFTTPEVTGEFKHKPNFEEAEGEIPSQSEEKSSTVESLKQNVQDVSNKISDKVQDVKDSIKERKEGGSEEKAPEEGSQQEEQSKERIPLVDQVMGRINAVNDNINSKIESVKNAFKIEETTDERQPLVDVVSGRLNDFSSKISHGIETVKSKVTPSHKEAPAQKEQEMPKSSEKGPSLKERISGSYQNMSYQMSENLHNLKDRLRPEQDATKKFHKVDSDEGFNPETVKEFKEEKRLQELGGHELVSDNPFESITVEEQPPTYFQKLKGKFVKENEEDEQIKDIEPVEESAESAKEGRSLRQAVNDNLESIKGKFRFGKDKAQEAGEEVSESKPLEEASESLEKKGEELSEPVKEESRSLRQAVNDNLESIKGKFRFGKDKAQEAGEEISESKPLEEKGKELASSLPQESQLKEVIDQNMENIQSKYRFMKEKGQEELNKPLEESTEPLKEEGKSLKERISGGLKNLSGKIPHPVDSLKSKLRSGKEEPQQEEIEPLDESSEPVQEEESQPEEASKPSMKERLAGTFEGLKSKFASGKGKSEEEGQEKEGEFHTVTEGTTETISQLKEEERIEPLLSNNPFEPLETKDTNLAQPLEGTDLVGGDLKELTSNENPSFKVEESSEGDEKIQNVSFFQKVKANIMSAFNHENKENEATQGDKNE